MGIRKTSRVAILDVATQLFAKSGYYGVSMSDVASAAGINKSSLYGYFTAKRDMAIDAVKVYSEKCKNDIFNILEQHDLKIDERRNEFFLAVNNYFCKSPEAIFVFIFGMEMQQIENEDKSIKEAILAHITGWRLAFERLYSEHDREQARKIAMDVMIKFCGGLVLHQIFRESEFLPMNFYINQGQA